MAKQVAPLPPARRPQADDCGVLAEFSWCGDYQAPCTLRQGHNGPHHDAVIGVMEKGWFEKYPPPGASVVRTVRDKED